ncbi:hypothetical protein JXA40_03445 [bacterium]|nr:hypothetical protein [candidate division CSSED10-310 bacterium]
MTGITGNTLILDMLDRAVRTGRLHHALLFHGPSGIGKYAAAIQLARRINCRSNPGQGCTDCAYCRQVRLPFPGHPDLVILKDAASPLIMRRKTFLERYFTETGLESGEIGVEPEAEYERTLDHLQSTGLIRARTTCREASEQTDVLYLDSSGSNQIRQAENGTGRLGAWLSKKLLVYSSSNLYRDTIKIEQIRRIQSVLSLHPYEAAAKMVIIDDAEKMNIAAQNCLLKTLEEPTGKSHLILVTANPSGLLPTIRSRCQPLRFQRLPATELKQLLMEQYGFSREAADTAFRFSEGSVQRALTVDNRDYERRKSSFERIFTDASERTAGDWAIHCVARILKPDEETGIEDHGQTLEDLFRWLYEKLHDMVHRGRTENLPILPGGRKPGLGHLIFLMNQLSRISSEKNFHIDIRLRLESVLIHLAGSADHESPS